jgi:phosphoglycolate phosphatase-like HAD superfamily hydrolase
MADGRGGSVRGSVLFDLDGTLVDSNYQHTMAWYRAFRAAGIVLPLWRIHRHVGMGGDKIVPALVGEARAVELGDALRDAHAERFASLIEEVSPLEGAHELLAALRDDGCEIALASSSSGHDLERYLGLLDAHELVASATTARDVEQTKPAPDLIEVAKRQARAPALAMVGDSPWDIEAAARADLPCITLLTGGYSERELRDAGAEAVFASLPDLQAGLGTTSIGRGR